MNFLKVGVFFLAMALSSLNPAVASDAESDGAAVRDLGGFFGSPKTPESPFPVAQCKLPNGKNGVLCKTGECVKNASLCPGKPNSPSHHEGKPDERSI